jgi:hypothetical protein
MSPNAKSGPNYQATCSQKRSGSRSIQLIRTDRIYPLGTLRPLERGIAGEVPVTSAQIRAARGLLESNLGPMLCWVKRPHATDTDDPTVEPRWGVPERDTDVENDPKRTLWLCLGQSRLQLQRAMVTI